MSFFLHASFSSLLPLAVHTLTVVAEAHLGLAETNGILASANAIELLQLGLVDALEGETIKSVLGISGAIDLSETLT